MSHIRTFVSLPGGVAEFQTPIVALKQQRLYNLPVLSYGWLHLYDKAESSETAYCPPAHIAVRCDAQLAAELSAHFAKMARQLRGVEE